MGTTLTLSAHETRVDMELGNKNPYCSTQLGLQGSPSIDVSQPHVQSQAFQGLLPGLYYSSTLNFWLITLSPLYIFIPIIRLRTPEMLSILILSKLLTFRIIQGSLYLIRTMLSKMLKACFERRAERPLERPLDK